MRGSGQGAVARHPARPQPAPQWVPRRGAGAQTAEGALPPVCNTTAAAGILLSKLQPGCWCWLLPQCWPTLTPPQGHSASAWPVCEAKACTAWQMGPNSRSPSCQCLRYHLQGRACLQARCSVNPDGPSAAHMCLVLPGLPVLHPGVRPAAAGGAERCFPHQPVHLHSLCDRASWTGGAAREPVPPAQRCAPGSLV